MVIVIMIFFCQAEDGIRDLVRSRGLGDVYKRQILHTRMKTQGSEKNNANNHPLFSKNGIAIVHNGICLLYTSDAADERSSVDLGGRRIIKKKTRIALSSIRYY